MTEILGVDIGGSGMKGTLVNVETGEMKADRFRLPTPESAMPDEMADVVGEIARHFRWQGPIGAGFPAVIRRGTAFTAANVDKRWIGTNVEALFSKATGCPTYVLNDADAAGLAEMRFGVGQDYPKGVVVLITIGTGLGTAIFVDGKLVPNTELGHLKMKGKDAEKRASDAARQKKEMTWEEWGGRFNKYLRYLEKLLWPDLFVLGGGVSKMSEKFMPYLTVKTETVPAKLLNQAGIIGAALYADLREKEKEKIA